MRPGGRESYQSTKAVSGLRALLLEVLAVSQLGLKNYFRYPAWLVSGIITTPAWLVLFLFPILMFLPKEQWSDPTVLNNFFWAMVLWDVVSSGLWSFGMAIRREQQTGTLEFILLTNANRAIMFARNLVTRVVTLGMTIAYTYAFFVILFGTPVIVASPLKVAAGLLTSLFTAMGFGLLYGAAVLRFKNVGPLNNVLQFVILGFSGVFFPVTSMPEPMRAASYMLPFTYVTDLVRHYALGYPTLLNPLHEWLLLITATVLMNMAGLLILRRIETSLKKTGGLGAY